jgi:hypothetical protein
MEDKVRFIPDKHIVDYPSRISHRVITEEDARIITKFTDRMSEMMDEYKVHMVINEYIYIGVWKDGVPIDKSMRVRVDGPVYNTIKEMNGGEFPRHIHIEEALKIDKDSIEPKI